MAYRRSVSYRLVQKVQLTTTSCNFGGVRYWFICPLSINGIYCGRRIGKLYCAPGTNYYGCRHCYNLSYESRNESRFGRIAQLGYVLKVERQYEKLYKKVKRWTYRDSPTKKARKLKNLERRLEIAISACKGCLRLQIDLLQEYKVSQIAQILNLLELFIIISGFASNAT